jgi:hypothetical protein
MMADPVLLDYDFGSTPSPLQASPATGDVSQATLRLLVTNNSGNPVVLEGLSVEFSVGDDGAGLLTAGTTTVVDPGGGMDDSDYVVDQE